jgi:xanthine/uracil permease
MAFGHKCTAGNKTFESLAPWVLAAMALTCVLVFRRIWVAVLALVLLLLALHFVSAWYLDSVHHGQPENENAAS